MAVNAAVPARNLPEPVALGKSRPDGLMLGSPGNGTTPHLAPEEDPGHQRVLGGDGGALDILYF